MSWFAEMVGQDLDSVAEREALNKRTGKVERGLGESIGDWIWQRDKSDIEKRRQEQEVETIKDSNQYADLNRTGKKRFAGDMADDLLGNVTYSTTPQELVDKKNEIESLIKGRTIAKGAGATEGQVMGLTDVGSLHDLATETRDARTRAKPGGADDKWSMYLEDRTINAQDKLDLRRDKLDQRKDEYMMRLEDLDLRRQQESNKMDIYRQQLSNQRADRKQTQMMALIQGLATLGSGFAL